MIKYLAILGTLFLTACGAYVAEGTVDYNQAIEQETNQLLVMNILRARDGVPTYYSDISQVRGTLSMGFQEPTLLGIAAIGKTTTRNSTTPNPSVQVSPSFDVAPLNTQDFTRGITEPLALSILQYYVDRGVPASVLLYLMIDKIEVTQLSSTGDTTVVQRYYNSPCSDRFRDVCDRGADNSDRQHGVDNSFYRKIQPWLNYLILNSYTLMQPSGPPTKGGGGPAAGGGREGGGAPPGGGAGAGGGTPMTLRPIGGGKYQMFTEENRIAMCVPVPTAREDAAATPSIPVQINPSPFGPRSASLYKEGPNDAHYFEVVSVPHTTTAGSPSAISDIFDAQTCVRNLVFVPPANLIEGLPPGMDADAMPKKGKAPAKPAAEVKPPSRPIQHTVVYLRSVDSIVTYLGELLRLKDPAQRPLPFDVSPRPHGNDRFSVSYNGERYYVANRPNTEIAGDPNTIDLSRDDRTLDILTLLNQLINLNKKSSELPSTRAVQSVP